MSEEITNEEYERTLSKVINADPADENACDSCQ